VLQYALWTLVFLRLLLPLDLAHPVSARALADSLLLDGSGLASGGRGVSTGSPARQVLPMVSMGRALAQAELAAAPALAGLWSLGFLLYLALHLRRLARYRRVIRDARRVSDPWLQALLESWRRHLGVERPVRLVSSRARATPFTAGVWQPVVFVPDAVLRDRTLVESVLAHELAHVARWDNLWLHVQNLVQAVYFFHPLVWLSGSRLNQERERICDAMVVSRGTLSPGSYAASLLGVVQLGLQTVEVPNMSVHKRRLAMRIRSLFSPRSGWQPRMSLSMIAALGLGFFILPMSGSGRAVAVPSVSEATSSEDAQSVSSKQVSAKLSLANPLPGGRVTWSFRKGRHPFSGKAVFHKGIDVAAPAGTPILAPADGRVQVATTRYEPTLAAGSVVILDHGAGYQTYYAHLGPLEVRQGQRVTRGQVLARVGSTGKSTGPHLHFEVRLDGEQLDPAGFVADWRKHAKGP
jgi:beta-lactamase regulating signal transducer with metallopeptidase domain